MKIKSVWTNKNTKQLSYVLSKIVNEKTMQNFLRDVMTEKEIEQIYAGKYQIMEGVGAPEVKIIASREEKVMPNSHLRVQRG